jgi:hypothetical protein
MPDSILHVDDGSPPPVTAGPVSPGLLLLMMNRHETEPKPVEESPPEKKPEVNPLIALFMKVLSEQSKLLRRLAEIYSRA